MKALSYFLAAAAGAALMALAFTQIPALRAPDALSVHQAKQVEDVLEKYLETHPELVTRAIERVDEKKKAAAVEMQRAVIKANAAALFNDPADQVLGNPKGDVSIVEFFDYRCPYCKRAMPTIMETVKADGNIRLVLKEFPILGPNSVLATRAALASIKQDRYAPFHTAMLASQSALDENAILSIAAANGIDIVRLAVDMKAPAIETEIRKTYQLAETLKIEGTPAFIIGDTLIPGALDRATLEKFVKAARSKT